MFQSTTCTVPWMWHPVKNYLSNCYSSMRLKLNPLAHQRPDDQGGIVCLLGCLSLLALERHLECMVGHAPWLQHDIRKNLVCVPLQLQQGSAKVS